MLLVDRLVSAASPRAGLERAMALAASGQPGKGLPLLVRAARAGLAEAEYRLGKHYLEGQIVPVSRAEALRWLERAGRQSHVEAQCLLASLYVQGLTGAADGASLFDANAVRAPDYGAAERWARLAAEAGSPDGQALLGYILTNAPEDDARGLRDEAAAHEWYRRASEGGSPQGARGYALSLSRRMGRPPDGPPPGADAARPEDVVRELTRAAEAGLPTAFYLLAVLTEKGVGVTRDQAAAAQFYRQSAERGNQNGQARWGLALLQGLGVEPDPDAGESWLRRAAVAGDPEAAALVGDLYSKSGDLPPNYAEAALWYRRAAEAGHKGAARALGLLYLTGAGLGRDPAEAANWFRVSAESGDKQAQADLANLLLRGMSADGQSGGVQGAAEDLVRTRQWFEEAANAGDLVAAFNYGVCLAEGVGIERNDARAAEWLRRAADGVVNAQYWYGRLLSEGRGVAPDAEAARAWIGRAAAAGMLDAQVALAEMMVNARGGARDHAGALALFEKAARKGHVGAMFALGALHGGGHDVPQNRSEAQRWFRAAAERGHAHGQLMLGRYLARGLTGMADPVEARAWLDRALAQGLAEARQDLAALAPEPGAQAEQRALTH